MTLLRLVRALPEPAIETRQVLGVNEFAFRRGRRYGTAPDALQVADRWHIVHNLVDALERMAVRVLAPLHKQRSADELSTLDKQRTTAPLPTLSRIQIRNERRHAEIHALRGRGLTIAAIADQLRLNRT